MNHKQPKGIIYDIQPFSVQDGPGIRTTVFLKGCPLRCPWCHSPESQEFYPQLSWIQMRCVGCGKCISLCPNNAISFCPEEYETITNGKIHQIIIDRDKCINCGTCTQKCYARALFISGTEYTIDQVLEKVKGDIPFYNTSGGGVTISGGEALSQPEFTLELLKALKELNIHTAVDTTGFTAQSNIQKVIPYTDLFLYDLKLMDSKKHLDVVGVPNEIILDNARFIAESDGQMQIRIPLITGINDDENNIRATAQFCKSIQKAVTTIQLLPFHDLGSAKYPRIGREQDIFTVPAVSDDRIEHCKKIFEEYGLSVTVH